jgi:protein SCO1/2
MMSSRATRRGLVVVAATASAVGVIVLSVGLFAGRGAFAADEFRGTTPPPGIGLPDFTLRDALGDPDSPVTRRDLEGKAVALTFLDTACSEVCPLIAPRMAAALGRLDVGQRGRVVLLAITANPEVDTPAAVRVFLERHRAVGRLHYLIGSPGELRPVWDAFSVVSALDSGDDDVHSARIRVYDRSGIWVSSLHWGVDFTTENLVHDLELALEG